MPKNPQHLKIINPNLLNRVQSLISDVDVNLDELLEDDDKYENPDEKSSNKL